MKEIADLDLMRRLWTIMREYRIPINDERILSMTEEQIDLTLWSIMLDEAKAAGKAEVFVDPDFDEEWEKLEKRPLNPKISDNTDEWEEV